MSDQEKGMERMEALWRGQKGAKGEKGETGETGTTALPFRLAWSLVVLFVIGFLIAGASLLLTAHENAQNNQKWCSTIDTLVIQKPPSGSATKNPSRAYEQRLYGDFTRLRTSLGCR